MVVEDNFKSAYCAERLKALSDPHRLRIIDALRYGEMTVSDLAEVLESEIVTISHHLKILKQASLVQVRREGRFMYHKIDPELLSGAVKGANFLDLGCCRLEVPRKEKQNDSSD
jgi:DNA-binding transcriptional ArsR family regulator